MLGPGNSEVLGQAKVRSLRLERGQPGVEWGRKWSGLHGSQDLLLKL